MINKNLKTIKSHFRKCSVLLFEMYLKQDVLLTKGHCLESVTLAL